MINKKKGEKRKNALKKSTLLNTSSIKRRAWKEVQRERIKNPAKEKESKAQMKRISLKVAKYLIKCDFLGSGRKKGSNKWSIRASEKLLNKN